MSWLVLAGLLVVAPPQKPSEELQRALRLDSSATRYRAAERLAVLGAEGEEWLLDEVGKGSPERQRALLLACALTGSEETLVAVEEAAGRGSRRRPDPQRAYALLLYGAYHPDAGGRPEADWERCQSAYEQACLLTGLLARPECLRAPAWDALLEDDGDPGLKAILDLGRLLAGEAVPFPEDADVRTAAAHLLASALPGSAPCPAERVDAYAGRLPALWLAAAHRQPGRDAETLRRMPVSGGGAAAGMLLWEAPEESRQELFLHFEERMVDPDARAWLWGSAGQLGLHLPAPRDAERLEDAEVAGILALALDHPAAAAEAASARLAAARAALEDSPWTAALVLALVASEQEQPDAGDLERLRALVEAAEPADKVRLWPVWNLARGALDDPANRRHWLARWARGLGAGPWGFLDAEGPRWAAYLLVGGTQAADERLQLLEALPELALPARDYSRDHNLYRDVADLLTWGFRFGGVAR